MGEEAKPRKSIFKLVFGTFFGLCAGAGTMYFNSAFNAVIRPGKPVANFSVASTDGLTANFSVKATGDSGWWDFGDGSELEPFDPNQPSVKHTYTKPGSYSAKLIVRNFLLDENDRSVTVDLSTPAASPNTLPPKLIGVQVQKLSDTVPAAYKITGEAQNTDEVVWAYGDRREHVVAQAGQFEKFVTIDKAGPATIVLTALSKAKATPDVFMHPVTVSNPDKNQFDVRLEIIDTVTRTVAGGRTHMVPVSTRGPDGKPAAGFRKVVSPGAKVTAATFEPKQMRSAAAVKNVKTEVSADGTAVTVTGEFDKTGNMTDVFIPVSVTEEKTSTAAPTRNARVIVLAQAGQQLTGSVRLPPPSPGTVRTVNLKLEVTQPNGQRMDLASGTLDAAGQWTSSLANYPGFGVLARMVNGEMQVLISNPPPAAVATPAPVAAPTPPVAKPAPAPTVPAPTVKTPQPLPKPAVPAVPPVKK